MQTRIIPYNAALDGYQQSLQVDKQKNGLASCAGEGRQLIGGSYGDWLKSTFKPKFKFNKSTKFFTIGSCFARNIEQALSEHNLEILSDTEEFFRHWKHKTQKNWTKGLSLIYLNKYITPSMASEIEWAVNPPTPEKHPAVVEARPKHWIDICASNFLSGDSEFDVRERRKIISDLMKRVYDADVFVITLGLTEAWYDYASGLYFNDPAPWLGIKDASKRIEFRNIGYDENLAALNIIADNIAKFSRKDVKIICTVSPVPLAATYSGQDIVLANTYSKSILRAVAEEFCKRKNVQYFPSFEYVMNSEANLTWEIDRRHVSTNFVRQIMNLFLSLFMNVEIA